MRTTVTLDADVERLLKDDAHARKQSFKIALNEAVRDAFRLRRGAEKKRKAFVVKARTLGFRSDIDYSKTNQIVDELEADAFVALTHRLGKEIKAS